MDNGLRLSRRLREAVKTSPVRQYRLAQAVGLHPSQLSALICGIYGVRAGDMRIVKLGALVGVAADECFAPAAPLPGGDHADSTR